MSQLVKSTGGKRAPYLKVTPQQKATVAKYAAEHGIVNAICHFKKDFPKLKESTIRGWKKLIYWSFSRLEKLAKI